MSSFLLQSALITALLASAGAPRVVHAEAPEAPDADSADSELGQAHWKRTRARVGLSFSVIAVPGGVVMLTWGIISRFSRSEGDNLGSGKGPRFDRAMITTGSLVIAGGLTGIALSGRGLRLAKREVKALESRPPATTFLLGPTTVNLVHRF